MSFALFTDSCCDMPTHYCKEHHIHVIPMSYLVNEEAFQDQMGTAQEYHDFYQRIRNGEMPSTTQVNVGEFITAFEPILANGQDILYIGLSSALSGTLNSARLAREQLQAQYPDRTIVSIDSASASMGQGLLVHQAMLLRQKGESIYQVAQWVEQNKLRVQLWFTVDDLNHLYRGGRLSRAAALMGTIAGIKPVLHLDAQGRLVPKDKVRGRKRALKALVDKMQQFATPDEQSPVFISHGDCADDAQAVADLVQAQFGICVDRIHFIGPVIGAHSGPGTVALFFMGEHRQA